jgi:hypothetical protein
MKVLWTLSPTESRVLIKVTVFQVKVKVKLSLCLTKHHAMKKYWEVEV